MDMGREMSLVVRRRRSVRWERGGSGVRDREGQAVNQYGMEAVGLLAPFLGFTGRGSVAVSSAERMKPLRLWKRWVGRCCRRIAVEGWEGLGREESGRVCSSA